MHQRIKEVRKSLKLTREAFGAKIGVSGDVINNIERNRNKRPVSPVFIEHLCLVYNVNEDWLKTGEGDMFCPPDASLLEEIKQEYDLSDDAAQFIKQFIGLDNQSRQELLSSLKKLL